MAFKTYAGLATTTTVLDADLLASYSGSGPLKSITAANVSAYIATKLSATWLQTANNLSDLSSAATARTNLGLPLGTSGATVPLLSTANTWTLAQTFTVAPVFTDAAGSRTALAALGSTNPTYTGGAVGNINTGGAGTLDVSVSDFHQRSISGNTTYTLQGGTAAKSGGFLLELTISSAAVPTFTGVKWEAGASPVPGNGRHLLGFAWNGTDWTGFLIAQAVS